MILSFQGATSLGPEKDPEPPQGLAPAPTVAPSVSLDTKLAHPIPGAGAHPSARAVAPPHLLGPVQVVVRALIHSPEMEELSGPLPDLKVQQGSACAPFWFLRGSSQHLSQWNNQTQPPTATHAGWNPKDRIPCPLCNFCVLYTLVKWLNRFCSLNKVLLEFT